MSRFIGREIQVGIGIEATGASRGTAVAPDFWLDKTDANIHDKSEVLVDEQSVGRIEDSLDASVVLSWAEGEISGRVLDQSFGVLLYAIFGDVSSSGETSPYTHTFTVKNTSRMGTVTIQAKDPNTQLAYALGAIDSLEITGEVGGAVEYKATFTSKRGVADTDEPVYVADEKAFLGKHVSVAIGKEDPVPLKSFTLTFNKNTEATHVMGTDTDPADILNRQFSVTLSGTVDRSDDAYLDMYRDGDISKVVITITNDNELNESDTPTCASLTITLPRVIFTDWTQTTDNNSIVTESFTGKALYDKEEEGYMANAVLVNGYEEYVAEA